jgi:hypothetical protein
MVDVKISNYIIGILIFTFVIVGGVSMLGIYNDARPINSTKYGEFNNTMNVLEDVTTEVDELEETVKDTNPEWGVLGALNALIDSGFQTMKLTFTSFNFMDNVFSGSTTLFGIPIWVATIIGAIITIIIVYAIYGAVFQRDL